MRSLDHCAADDITLVGELAALADLTRLQIARLLSDGAEHVLPDVPAELGPSTLSYRANRLRQASIAHARQEGMRCFVSARPDLAQQLPGLQEAVLSLATT